MPNFNMELGSYIRLAGRWAVPFFFITTGYFMGKKIGANNTLSFTTIQKNFVNLISIFLVASAIYFAWTWATSSLWFFNEISLVFWGGYWHLWFISSMIFGYLVIWYFYAVDQAKWLPVLSIVILVIALFSDSYDIVFDTVVNYEQLPRMLLAIPFMYIGIYIANRKTKPNQLSVWVVVLVIGFLLQYLEMLFLYKRYDLTMHGHQLLIGTSITSVAMFMLSLLISTKKTKGAIYGKKYSLFIYLYHLIAFWGITQILVLVNIPLSDYIKLTMPILGFIATLLVALLLDRYVPKLFMVLNGSFGSFKAQNTEP